AVVWTRRQLTDPVRRYLEGLPLRATLDTALCVHGSVRDPIEEYIFDVATARASFDAAPFALCLVGHTHVPAVFTQAGEAVVGEPLLPGQSLRLQSDRRYIINVGSVGQPRDGDPRAAYLWLDTAEQIATLVRLEYPISQTQQKVLAAGLPALLAERLAVRPRHRKARPRRQAAEADLCDSRRRRGGTAARTCRLSPVGPVVGAGWAQPRVCRQAGARGAAQRRQGHHARPLQARR